MNNISAASPSLSYGLYLDTVDDEEKTPTSNPSGPNSGGKWLEEEATIAQYAGPNNHIRVVFRNQTLFLKVSDLHEEVTKTIPFNESRALKDQMEAVTKRFGLSHPLEYALQKLQKGKLVWLNPAQTLNVQCSRSDKLFLRRKFFLTPHLISAGPPAVIHFAYCEARHTLLNGHFRVTEKESTDLAALQMQIMYKNYDPLIHTHRFIQMKEVLPKQFAYEYMEAEVFAAYRKLKDTPESEAKNRFLRRCMRECLFGASVFLACESLESFDMARARLLGVKHDEIVCCDAETKELLWSDNLFLLSGLVHHDRAVQWTLQLSEQVVRRSFMFEGPEEASAFCDYYNQYILFGRMDETELHRMTTLPGPSKFNDRFRALSVSPKHRKIRTRSASSENVFDGASAPSPDDDGDIE